MQCGSVEGYEMIMREAAPAAIYNPRRVTKLFRSSLVATANTNFRPWSVTVGKVTQNIRMILTGIRSDCSPSANRFFERKSSSSAKGESGLIIVYGSEDVRLNLVMY